MPNSDKKTTILIVDDSRIFRSVIQECFNKEKNVEVVGSVWSGSKALEFIQATPPDLVTLDVQMPGMDGLETLQAIQKFNTSLPDDKQVGVVMLSALTQQGADTTVKALEMGAFDFIPKPEGINLADNINLLCHQLSIKVRHYAKKRYTIQDNRKLTEAVKQKKATAGKHLAKKSIHALFIGVSTGGPKALGILLPQLCEKLDIPIFVVQHMPATFTESLARSLNNKCRYKVIEGKHGDYVLKNHVYIAPGGKHMSLSSTNRKNVQILIQDDPPRKGHKPSVDYLFESASKIYAKNAIGIVLTGMGSDGTAGSELMKKSGAHIIVQDEESSIVWGMPSSVINAGAADEIYPLNEIPDAVESIIEKRI